MRLKSFYLKIFLLLFHLVNSCPPLVPKMGVKLECKMPNSTISDCSTELPIGTNASFTCAKYYLKNEGEMICSEDDQGGFWEHFYDYEDFHCTIQCGVSQSATPVIVIGSAVSKYDFPWHAAIFTRNPVNDSFDLNCGGSLIDLNSEGPLILTAAHCLPTLVNEDYRVILGANSSTFLENKDKDSQIFGVSYFEVYPSYNETSLENDISVMKLKGNVVYSDTVQPICLDRATSIPKDRDMGIVAGFGKTEKGGISKRLLYAALPIRTRSECEQKFPKNSKINFPATKFCAGFNYDVTNAKKDDKISPGICFGDSGGGLTVFNSKSTLVGIAHVAIKDPNFTCSGLGYFQSVQKYIGWIREVQKIVYSNKDIPNPGSFGGRCGLNPEWVEFKDEKCFKLVKQLVTKIEASKICESGFAVGNSIGILKASEEHEFLLKFLEEKRVTNGVWLGAAKGPLGFHWDNGDEIGHFSNWAPNPSGKNCSIIQPRTGFWVEEDCEAENLVVCEKLEEFSNAELLQTIIKMKANINEINERLKLEGNLTEKILKMGKDLEEAKSRLKRADTEIIDIKSRLDEKVGALNATLYIFIEKQSSMKAVLDSVLSEKYVIDSAGSRVLELITGTWYTFSNKIFEDRPTYMTWMLDGAIKYGQISYETEYVDKYKSINNFDGHWMIRKMTTPGAYTLYNRGAKGYLIKNTNDNYLRFVEESELIPDIGYWCFTADTGIYFRIHLCKVTKDGKGSLDYSGSTTVEGSKLVLYTMNSKSYSNFWSAKLVGSI